MILLHRVELPIELTNGNDGRGNRWFKPAGIRKKIEAVLRLTGQVRGKPFQRGVLLRITRVLGVRQQLWDSDSIGRGNSKELVDSLVAVGWFEDDGPKHIRETQFAQYVPDKRGKPSVIVEVMQ